MLDRSYATRNVFDAACHLADVKPSIFFESRSVGALLAMAERGHGVAIVPSVLKNLPADIGTKLVTHRDEPLPLKVAVIWDRRRTTSRHAEQFARAFAQDAERCAGQYPPGEAVLFYHPFPGDDVSRARSLDGKLYADQEYAFAFRKAFMPHCVARLHQGLTALKERVFTAVPTLLAGQSEAGGGAATGLVPVALARPDLSSDPETLANRAGGLVPEPVAPPVAGIAIRMVGDPSYFAEGSPGPPPTVPGYVAPELKDFRVTETSALETPPRVPDRAGGARLGGAY